MTFLLKAGIYLHTKKRNNMILFLDCLLIRRSDSNTAVFRNVINSISANISENSNMSHKKILSSIRHLHFRESKRNGKMQLLRV